MNEDVLKGVVSAALNGHARSLAILDDYVKVIEQLTGTPADEVRSRVETDTKIKLEDFKKKLVPPEQPSTGNL